MGMFEAPRFLTGKDRPYAITGETFFLCNARISGTTNQGGSSRPLAKLQVKRDEAATPEVVYTSGRGIVAQVERMTNEDRERFPLLVRLDEIPPKTQGNNPTYVLTPADQPEPVPATTTEF